MAHGGRRAGAGRKKTLDFMSRLHVGARAHNFQAKVARRGAIARFDKAMIACGVRSAQKRSLSILRTDGFEYWRNSFEGEDAREDLGFSLLTHHGLANPDPLQEPEPEDAPRGVHLEWTAYGTRKYVLKVTARWATWYYGVRVTPRRVRDYWEEYRQFLRDT